MRQVLRVLILIGLFVLFINPSAQAASTNKSELLPDLYQEIPYNLEVEQFGTGSSADYHLGFGSTVYNFGTGPLTVVGHRDSTATPQMDASQVIQNKDGSTTTVPNIGKMQYVDSITHQHWHYLKFDNYALETMKGKPAALDRKTGFCLGDRFVAQEDVHYPNQPPDAVYTDNCRFQEPDALDVSEGISINYGDSYLPQLEGQYVDITGVPAGRYSLVHRVNIDRSLKEINYSDDVASVLVEISYPQGPSGPPKVVQLARCALSATCPVAPELTKRKALAIAKAAFVADYKAKSLHVACSAPSKNKTTCIGRWSKGAGTVKVGYLVKDGRVYSTASTTGKSTSGSKLKSRSGRTALPEKPTAVPLDDTPDKAAAKTAVYYCPLGFNQALRPPVVTKKK